jgi:hypothetical protein
MVKTLSDEYSRKTRGTSTNGKWRQLLTKEVYVVSLETIVGLREASAACGASSEIVSDTISPDGEHRAA